MTNDKFQELWAYFKAAALSFWGDGGELIDWTHAAAVAFKAAAVEVDTLEPPSERVRDEFAQLVRRVEPEIAAFTHLTLPKPLGCPVVFNRREWIVTALSTIQPLLAPVIAGLESAASSSSSSERLTKGLLTIQIGSIFGYLARRVLGQYDLPLAGGELSENDGRLYFIYPNIVFLEEGYNIERREFRLWLALHEATHSYEFESHPWLRTYLWQLVNEHGKFLYSRLKGMFADHSAMPPAMARVLLSGSVRELVSFRDNQTLGKIQAFMAVVEGYSEYVMRHLSQKIIPHSPAIKELFARQERTNNFAERLLERFIGLDIKLSQYKLGRDFIQALAEGGGMDLVNQVWSGPEYLPEPAELEEPWLWIKKFS